MADRPPLRPPPEWFQISDPRPTPKRRPDPRLSNPRPDSGPGRVGLVLLMTCFLVVGVAAILSIWARTCGLGVVC